MYLGYRDSDGTNLYSVEEYLILLVNSEQAVTFCPTLKV
jgi:hypothetical protein